LTAQSAVSGIRSTLARVADADSEQYIKRFHETDGRLAAAADCETGNFGTELAMATMRAATMTAKWRSARLPGSVRNAHKGLPQSTPPTTNHQDLQNVMENTSTRVLAASPYASSNYLVLTTSATLAAPGGCAPVISAVGTNTAGADSANYGAGFWGNGLFHTVPATSATVGFARSPAGWLPPPIAHRQTPPTIVTFIGQ
jgi:hypothetical protein